MLIQLLTVICLALASCAPHRSSLTAGPDAAYASTAVTISPVIMPKVINKRMNRIALIPIDKRQGSLFREDVNEALNFLKLRQSNIVIVERDLQPVYDEIQLQHGGLFEDSSMVRIGRMMGADALLMYRAILMPIATTKYVSRSGGYLVAGFELRLIDTETGTVLFQQEVTANSAVAAPNGGLIKAADNELVHAGLLKLSSRYTVSAFLSACGENPLGVVWDSAHSGPGARILGAFQGSPGAAAGLDVGDIIEASNGVKLKSWLDAFDLPAHLTVRKGQSQRTISVWVYE
jgi:hypothetical protein